MKKRKIIGIQGILSVYHVRQSKSHNLIYNVKLNKLLRKEPHALKFFHEAMTKKRRQLTSGKVLKQGTLEISRYSKGKHHGLNNHGAYLIKIAGKEFFLKHSIVTEKESFENYLKAKSIFKKHNFNYLGYNIKLIKPEFIYDNFSNKKNQLMTHSPWSFVAMEKLPDNAIQLEELIQKHKDSSKGNEYGRLETIFNDKIYKSKDSSFNVYFDKKSNTLYLTDF